MFIHKIRLCLIFTLFFFIVIATPINAQVTREEIEQYVNSLTLEGKYILYADIVYEDYIKKNPQLEYRPLFEHNIVRDCIYTAARTAYNANDIKSLLLDAPETFVKPFINKKTQFLNIWFNCVQTNLG
jgi:hypothetical protein